MTEMKLEGPIQQWGEIKTGTGGKGPWAKRSFKISNVWVGIFSAEAKLKEIETLLPVGTGVECITIQNGNFKNLKPKSLHKLKDQPAKTELTPEQNANRPDTGKPTQAPVHIYDNNSYWREKHELDKMIQPHLALKGAGDIALELMKMSKDTTELNKNITRFKATQKDIFSYSSEVTQNLTVKKVFDGRWLLGFSGNIDQYDQFLADKATEKINGEKAEQQKLAKKEPEQKTEVEEVKDDEEIKSIDDMEPLLS